MVYIHVPFCRSFCTYCDFYSEIACRGRDAGAINRYVAQLVSEIGSRREQIKATLDCDTLYIGGGTPSVLPLSSLQQIVASLSRVVGSDSGRATEGEFTIEVNPEDIIENGADYVRGLIKLGVNRFSMGVQSTDDGILKWMNRRHDAAGACEAFSLLRSEGAENISVDIIFGLSQLDSRCLSDTIVQVLEWHPEHISAYQLSIEEDSVLAGMVRDGRYKEAADGQCAAQYELICRLLSEAGYRHYEISNWALPGFESRHNSAYWRRVPYVGLGPGAHSFDGIRRSWNSQSLSDWTSSGETLTAEEAREEEIMLGLRTDEGIPSGLCPHEALSALLSASSLQKVSPAAASGQERVRIPEDRFFVCDDIISSLL